MLSPGEATRRATHLVEHRDGGNVPRAEESSRLPSKPPLSLRARGQAIVAQRTRVEGDVSLRQEGGKLGVRDVDVIMPRSSARLLDPGVPVEATQSLNLTC